MKDACTLNWSVPPADQIEWNFLRLESSCVMAAERFRRFLWC
jgi:hypothetical protein